MKFKKKFFIFTLLTLIFIFVATLASFLFFGGQEKKPMEVNLKIQGPEKITSGEEVIYNIIIENQERVDLKNLEVNLRFPQGFYWRDSKPASLNPLHTVYQWAEIKSGKKEKLEIKGQLIGQVDEEKNLEAVLIYQPANFHSDLEKKVSFTTKIISSTLEIDLQGPEKSLVDQEVNYIIKLKNISQAPLEKVKVSVVLPVDLEIKEISPELKEEEKNVWIFERIESEKVTSNPLIDSGQEIKIKGIFSGTQGQQEEIKVSAGLLLDDGFVLQAEASLVTLLFNPKLNLDFTVNGQEGGVVVDWGDSLDYLVKFKNESNLEMANINFQFPISNFQKISNFQFSNSKNLKWELENGKWKIEIENPEQIPALDSLKPGEEGKISFKIDLPKNSISSQENVSLENQVEIEAGLPELSGQRVKFSSKAPITKIQSKVFFGAEARYYDDNYQIIGAGPLPPKYGQQTLYRIYWFLENTSNELRNVQIKTKLPLGVSFLEIGQIEQIGRMFFDPNSREVTWSIDEISSWSGEIKTAFQVGVIPTSDQVDKVLALLGPTTLEAQDQFTKTSISLEAPALLSNLIFDPVARGKGIVE